MEFLEIDSPAQLWYIPAVLTGSFAFWVSEMYLAFFPTCTTDPSFFG